MSVFLFSPVRARVISSQRDSKVMRTDVQPLNARTRDRRRSRARGFIDSGDAFWIALLAFFGLCYGLDTWKEQRCLDRGFSPAECKGPPMASFGCSSKPEPK